MRYSNLEQTAADDTAHITQAAVAFGHSTDHVDARMRNAVAACRDTPRERPYRLDERRDTLANAAAGSGV